MRRGEVWWATLPPPVGSGPGGRRPVVVIQSNTFSASRIKTVIVAIVTSNLELAKMPGNIPLSPRQSGLDRESVINVTQLTTVDKSLLTEPVGTLPRKVLEQLNASLKLVLDLD